MAATLLYDIRANSAVGPYYKMIESATLVEHNKLYGFSATKLTNS
jgi:hypothetical protein